MIDVSVDTTTTPSAKPKDYKDFAKGTWQATLAHSSSLFDKSSGDRKRASQMLWQGGTAAIADWETTSAASDASGENLTASLLDVMGTSRKGDVSKIKTVALAVRDKGLVTSTYGNLSKAYSAARALLKADEASAKQKADDEAAEKVIADLAEAAPNSTTTIEGAVALLFSKGMEAAVVAILDALNGPSKKHNGAAHRSFMREVATEVAAREQAAKPKPAPKATTGAKNAAKRAQAPKATPKASTKAPATTKAKAPAKATATKAEPVKAESASKGDPNKKALPPKKASVPVAKRAVPVARKA